LQRLGGDEFVGKMIDLFLGYTAEKLAGAQQAQTAGNWVGVADAVHPIKSSAGNVGARRVQELAAQIEQLGRQSQGGTLPGLIAELETAFAAVKTDLEQTKKTLAARPDGAGKAESK